jgi:hypothetical protein
LSANTAVPGVDLDSGGGGAVGCRELPQFLQNFPPCGFWVPHFEHIGAGCSWGIGFPQEAQNLLPSGFTVPHDVQFGMISSIDSG